MQRKLIKAAGLPFGTLGRMIGISESRVREIFHDSPASAGELERLKSAIDSRRAPGRREWTVHRDRGGVAVGGSAVARLVLN
jgi:hypothetical protein